jgi:glycosyltransferase involved in cell wall biosynthesis
VAFLLARRVARSRAKVILDVQGDWRHATRLYGSRLRRLLNPLNDVLGPLALRGVDGVRTISTQTSALVRARGVEPLASFPPYVDVEAFLSRPPEPLPERPGIVYVGALERVKAFDTLVAAWRLLAARLPEARLTVVGGGRLSPLAEELVPAFPGRVVRHALLSSEEVAAAIDAGWLLVLPSRSEGLGRVLLEAACRGRALVGARRGGIPDLVQEDGNGLLVDPEDAHGLADALARVLSDRAYAERLGAAARVTAEAWSVTPAQYAERVAALVRATLEG